MKAPDPLEVFVTRWLGGDGVLSGGGPAAMLAELRALILSQPAGPSELSDDPELDGTDGAHPAWWRGDDHGGAAVVKAITDILDGKDTGAGVCREPLETVRRRLLGLIVDGGDREDYPTLEDALKGLARWRASCSQWQEWADGETERLGLNHPNVMHGRLGAQELLTSALAALGPVREPLDAQLANFVQRWIDGSPENAADMALIMLAELRALVIGAPRP